VNFDQAFKKLIGHEGGFTKDVRDKGNWTGGALGKGKLKGTKFGISAAAYPQLDIESLTIEDAKVIYLHDYWNELNLDLMPNSITFDLFDTAVNSGVTAAKKILQKALGVKVDGKIGPITISAANHIDPQLLDKKLNGARLLYMVEANAWTTYNKGWATRIANNLLED
jgi:lysozyme family protein